MKRPDYAKEWPGVDMSKRRAPTHEELLKDPEYQEIIATMKLWRTKEAIEAMEKEIQESCDDAMEQEIQESCENDSEEED